jgi:hypothetical protein
MLFSLVCCHSESLVTSTVCSETLVLPRSPMFSLIRTQTVVFKCGLGGSIASSQTTRRHSGSGKFCNSLNRPQGRKMSERPLGALRRFVTSALCSVPRQRPASRRRKRRLTLSWWQSNQPRCRDLYQGIRPEGARNAGALRWPLRCSRGKGSRRRAPGRFVIIEFDSLQNAQKWYQSPEYQVLIPIRQKASKSTLFIAEGIPK